MKTLTIDKIFDNIKNEGQKSKETVEIANNISRIINNIVQTRIEMGITQQELADRCGLKQSAIARIEKIQVMPRLDTVIRIAKNLNMSFDINKIIYDPDFTKITEAEYNAIIQSEKEMENGEFVNHNNIDW